MVRCLGGGIVLGVLLVYWLCAETDNIADFAHCSKAKISHGHLYPITHSLEDGCCQSNDTHWFGKSSFKTSTWAFLPSPSVCFETRSEELSLDLCMFDLVWAETSDWALISHEESSLRSQKKSRLGPFSLRFLFKWKSFYKQIHDLHDIEVWLTHTITEFHTGFK